MARLTYLRLSLSAVVLSACIALAPASASAAPSNGWGFGVADPAQNQFGFFNVGSPGNRNVEAYFAKMQPRIYRVQIPYDLAGNPAPEFQARALEIKDQIVLARRLGVQHVLATFAHGYTVGGPANLYRPTPSEYATGIQANIEYFNQYVDAWSPANEPNAGAAWLADVGDSTAGSRLLAQYFNALRLALPAGDELVSPEFHDTVCGPSTPASLCDGEIPGMRRQYSSAEKPSDTRSAQKVYILRYLSAVEAIAPGVSGWGERAAFHPYGAVARQTAGESYPAVDEFIGLVTTGAEVWLTEIGSLLRGERVPADATPASQDSQVNKLVNVAKNNPRIGRAYYYNMWDDGNPTWDSGLIDQAGAARPAFKTWCSVAAGNASNCSALQVPSLRRAASTDWLAPLEQEMHSLGRPESATVVLTAIRGLLMAPEPSSDGAQAFRAFTDFLTTIEGD